MGLLDISLIFSILFCSLVGGFIFTYAIVVMPGLSKLSDKDFIRAFQVTDTIIQNNQPVFMFTWIGSIVALLTTILISMVSVGLSEAWLVIIIGAAYLLGVQGITVAIHIPLNNHIQKIKIEELTDKVLTEERSKFETKWNVFNNIRTGVAISVMLLLLILLSLR
ncbi:MAG: DUF1772 domain-containing protein [Dehalococcoidia bacterium]|tara:strand:- start:947 stop:1441 length:495 start_codon:yes stop_codon:yes gene_type:complete